MADQTSIDKAKATLDRADKESEGVADPSDIPEGETEEEDRQIFLRLEKPRVRYDVEVVTKLIVYAGIGWWAAAGNPVLFELCGLGMSY